MNKALHECPSSEISGKDVRLRCYLPDIQKGFYRATRFDWSGIIFSLEYKYHQFSGLWFDQYDPEIHDAVCGPADEFAPVGFEQAHIGDEFLKIGIGTLRKSTTDYRRFGLYQIVNPGRWKIQQGRDRLVFTHLLESEKYSYVYRKVMTLSEKKPKLVLAYSLKNTGTMMLETNVFNHNFFVIDRQVTGPDIMIGFPFEPNGKWRDVDGPAVIRERRIVYRREFNKGESVFMENMYGFNPQESFRVTIENHLTKTGVHIRGNRNPFRMTFWASYLTSCPEAFIKLSVSPGEEFTWTNSYEFYEF